MNPVNDLKIRELDLKDLQSVAEVHQKAFTDSALTKLGLESIRRYYEWQMTGPHDCYGIGVFSESNMLLGFCFAGVFKGSLAGFVAKNKQYLIRYIISHPWLIGNPIIYNRLKSVFRIFFKKLPKNHKDPENLQQKHFSILSIATAPEFQRKGIGRMIVDWVGKLAIGKGYDQLALSVHPENQTAVAFYEKCGWGKKLDEDHNWTGIMTFPLEKEHPKF